MMAAEHTHAHRRTRRRPTRAELHTPTDLDRCVARAVESSRCLWPGCDRSKARYPLREYGEVPLCVAHVYETWRLARDLATSRNERDRTIEVYVGGKFTKVEKPTSLSGWIYYLRIGDHIKIGYASKLEQRLRQYPPTAEFIYAHRGTKTDEKVIHSLLYLYRAAGREWYNPCPQIDDHIAKMRNRYGDTHDPRPRPKPETSGYHIQIRSRSGGSYTRKKAG